MGRDLARVLPGPFASKEGWLEGPDYVITWAVGHLVQLAEPDDYDAKYKRWRMPDLPIVPSKFKLVVRDERSRKQMSAVTAQLGREDVGQVINACDAGREGELIFAYLYEKAKASKPVQRLWLNSMTNAAMKEAFASLRPAEDFALLEQAARSRSEADWIVGMNATRAATIRLKSSFDGAVSLGRVQTPTLAIIARREEEIRAFVPEPYWLVDATFDAGPLDGAAEAVTDGERGPRARVRGPLPHGLQAPHRHRAGGARDRRGLPGKAGHHHQAGVQGAARARSDAVRPYDPPARRQHALRLLGATNPGGRPAPLRGAQGAHLPPHELALPDDRHGGGDQAHRGARGRAERVREGGRLCHRPRRAAARASGEQREGHRPPRDHPHQGRARRGPHGRRRQTRLRHGREALPRRLPSRGGVREHARRDDRLPAARGRRTAKGRRVRVPHARKAPAGAGLARGLRADALRGEVRGRGRRGRRPAAAEAGRASPYRRSRSRASARKPSRRDATATLRCWARWRPPASSSTTTSCARP